MATKTSDRLEHLLGRFHEEQFLRDYQEPNRLLFRLNQVMLRVRLDPLPDEMADALATSWSIVRDRVEELLPRDRFSFL